MMGLPPCLIPSSPTPTPFLESPCLPLTCPGAGRRGGRKAAGKETQEENLYRRDFHTLGADIFAKEWCRSLSFPRTHHPRTCSTWSFSAVSTDVPVRKDPHAAVTGWQLPQDSPSTCLLIIGLTIQGPNPALCVVGKNSWIVTPLPELTAGTGLHLRLRGSSQQTQPLARLINHPRPGDSEFLAVPGRPREGPLLARKFC